MCARMLGRRVSHSEADGVAMEVGPGIRLRSERVVDQPERDLVGHDRGPGHGGGGVLKLGVDVVGDDDSLEGLSSRGEVPAEPTHVSGELTDDLVGWAASLRLDCDEGTGRSVTAQESRRPTGVEN